MEAAQFIKKHFVEIFLPFFGALLAKKDTATHRPDRVDRAEAIDLERARFLWGDLRELNPPISRGLWRCLVGGERFGLR